MIHPNLSFQASLGLRMLMDPSKAQHRIWEDVDFCELKIDNGFVTNQWQLFSMNFFPNESCPNCWSLLVRSPILQWCRTYALKCDLWNSWRNFWIHEKFFTMNVARIHRRRHEHSPNYWMLFCRICNVRHSVFFALDLLLYSQILLRHFPRRKFPILPPGNLHYQVAPIHMNYLSVPYGLRTSVEKSIFMMKDELVAPHSKKFSQVSLIDRTP